MGLLDSLFGGDPENQAAKPQKNRTLDFLDSVDPHIADAVRSGMIDAKTGLAHIWDAQKSNKPSIGHEYEGAKGQGFKGSLADYVSAKHEGPNGPPRFGADHLSEDALNRQIAQGRKAAFETKPDGLFSGGSSDIDHLKQQADHERDVAEQAHRDAWAAAHRKNQSLPHRLGADHTPDSVENLDAHVAEGRREAFQQLPWYKQLGVAADDVVRGMGNGASFGFADKLAAKMNSLSSGRSYEDELKIQEEMDKAAEARGGGAMKLAELTGNAMTAGGLMKNGLTMAGRLGTEAMPGVSGVLARGAILVPEGAALGALDARGHDRPVLPGAAGGALAAPLGSMAVDGTAAGSKVVTDLLARAKVISPKLADHIAGFFGPHRDVLIDAAAGAASAPVGDAAVDGLSEKVHGLSSMLSGKALQSERKNGQNRPAVLGSGTIMHEPQNGRGYTAGDKALLQKLVRPSTGQNMNKAGRLAPIGTIPRGTGAALGSFLGGPANPGNGPTELSAIGQALTAIVRGGGNQAALNAARDALAKLAQPQR